MNYKVIIGLGNPGQEFEATHHNAGMLALMAIAARFEAHGETLHFRRHGDLFEYAKAPDVILVRPLTFMNESGRAVREALRTFSLGSRDLLVLHDDSDLPMGEYKITSGQNAAGHHGVTSIIDELGANDFARARIGIRSPDEVRRKKASEFVLAPLTEKDKEKLEKVFGEIIKTLGMS